MSNIQVGEFSRDYSDLKPVLRRSNWVIYSYAGKKRCFFKPNFIFNNAVSISSKKALKDRVSRTSLTLKNKSIFLHIFMCFGGWYLNEVWMTEEESTGFFTFLYLRAILSLHSQSYIPFFMVIILFPTHPVSTLLDSIYPTPVGSRQEPWVFSSFFCPLVSFEATLFKQLWHFAHFVPLNAQGNFRHASSGRLVSREELMTILSRLAGLHIRALYFTETQRLTLGEVGLEEATSHGSGSVALSVEMCACPPQYTGDSCQVGTFHTVPLSPVFCPQLYIVLELARGAGWLLK